MTRRLVLFDVDGTLVDSQHDIVASMTHAFESQGLAAPTRGQTLSIVGLSVPEAIEALTPDVSDAVRAALALEFRTGGPQQRAPGGKQDLLYPGALETIASLTRRDDVVLGVATGKSRRGVARLFDRYDWHPHFKTIQTADTNPSKPHPGMITTAMAEVGAEPYETIMIGDTSFDMAMARAAGVTAIGVAWGYHPVADIERAGAHRIVQDYATLLSVLDGPFALAR